MTFLIFDSIDKCGKDSLIQEFHKATNFKFSAINRWSGTSFSYGKLYNRKLEYRDYILQDINLMNDGLLVYLYASKDVLKKRFKEHNEKDINLNKDYDKLKRYYERYLSMTPLKAVKIDTGKNDIKKSVQLIINAGKEFRIEDVKNKVYRLINTISKIGNKVGNTLELTDVTLKFNQANIYYLPKLNVYMAEEKAEFDNIYYSLKNSIRLKLFYFKNQKVDSRQFVYHNDSCISLFHVMKRGNNLEVFVTIRSSNVVKSLLFDIYGLYEIANKLNKDFFLCRNLNFTIKINSAHIYLKK